jgi:hypothetical protein
MGRCGRAGKQTGRGIVFFGDKSVDSWKSFERPRCSKKAWFWKGEVVESEEDEDQAGEVQKPLVKKGFH